MYGGITMQSVDVFFEEMLVLYSIALLGFLVKKFRILNEHTNDVLTQLILYITLPALILFSLDIPFSITMAREFLWLVSMSAYVLVFSIFIAIWMRSRSQLSHQQKSVYEGLIIFGNQGFIGYAVSFILLGEQGIVYLTMFNLCYLVLIWTYGIYLFSNETDIINRKTIFLNPGILATMTGLMLFLLPIHLPEIVSKSLGSIGNMTIPLSMMLIGCLCAKVTTKDLAHLARSTYLWKVAITRLVLIPLLLLPFVFSSVPFSLLIIAVVVSGMPSAPTISLYAQKYGGDPFFASLGVLITSVLCIVTIPFLYFIVGLFY